MKKADSKLLIEFLLNCAAARDPRAVIDVTQKFLLTRLEPESIEIVRDAGVKVKPFGETHLLIDGKNMSILFRFKNYQQLELKNSKNEVLSDYELQCFESALGSAFEKHNLMTDLRGLSYTDDVTGLYNQRYLETILDREVALANRQNTPFSILFLDLDHFKKVNDKYGHLIGSRILFEVGEEIKPVLRESDLTFRYGGDEFVVVLTQTELVEAMQVAERVRVQIAKKRFLVKEGLQIRVTTSVGVAAFPEHALTKDEILTAADNALYDIKENSRNAVVMASIPKGA